MLNEDSKETIVKFLRQIFEEAEGLSLRTVSLPKSLRLIDLSGEIQRFVAEAALGLGWKVIDWKAERILLMKFSRDEDTLVVDFPSPAGFQTSVQNLDSLHPPKLPPPSRVN